MVTAELLQSQAAAQKDGLMRQLAASRQFATDASFADTLATADTDQLDRSERMGVREPDLEEDRRRIGPKEGRERSERSDDRSPALASEQTESVIDNGTEVAQAEPAGDAPPAESATDAPPTEPQGQTPSQEGQESTENQGEAVPVLTPESQADANAALGQAQAVAESSSGAVLQIQGQTSEEATGTRVAQSAQSAQSGSTSGQAGQAGQADQADQKATQVQATPIQPNENRQATPEQNQEQLKQGNQQQADSRAGALDNSTPKADQSDAGDMRRAQRTDPKLVQAQQAQTQTQITKPGGPQPTAMTEVLQVKVESAQLNQAGPSQASVLAAQTSDAGVSVTGSAGGSAGQAGGNATGQMSSGVNVNVTIDGNGVTTTEPVPQEQAIDRMAQVTRIAMNRGQWQAQIRISPPDLGTVRMDVSVRQNMLTLRVIADHPEARQMLQSRMGELREALGQHGITVDRIDVEARRTTAGENTSQGQDQQSSRQGSNQSGAGGGSTGDGREGSDDSQGFGFNWGEQTGHEGKQSQSADQQAPEADVASDAAMDVTA